MRDTAPHPMVSMSSRRAPPCWWRSGWATTRVTTTESTFWRRTASVEAVAYGTELVSSAACSSVWLTISRVGAGTTGTLVVKLTYSGAGVGDFTSLPATGAIVWGKPSGKTVTVFSDFRCGYCRALSNTLRTMNVRVIERPISVLGSRDLANQVYCAKNREEALHQAYAGEPLRNAGTCDTSGLDANEKFARAHGLSGTPVIVRADGAMIEGYRPKEALAAFIAGGRS